MEKINQTDLISRCLLAVEKKLNWGNSVDWTNQDFETLSEKIQEQTGIRLSIVTLKRLWGKLTYNSKPTTTTLNTLANFVGFDNWRHFKQNQDQSLGINPISDATPDNISVDFKLVKKNRKPFTIGLLLILSLGLIFLLNSNLTPRKSHINNKYRFSSKKVITEGLPNSVVFDYDATAADPTDSIFIQQSWDKNKTHQVSRENHKHTSIYYYPGFFKAKLVINGKIIKEHNINIKTAGWLPLIEQPGTPVYFIEADARRKNGLQLSIEQILEKNITLQPQTPWISFYRVEEFQNITTDNFQFETSIKNTYNEGAAACQLSEVLILFENGAFQIPLSAKGCIADLKMYLADHQIEGTKEDLTKLGADLSQWVKVTCSVKEKRIAIYVNDSLAYKDSFEVAPSKIEGIAFRFKGTGAVGYLKLANASGQVVYEENFLNRK